MPLGIALAIAVFAFCGIAARLLLVDAPACPTPVVIGDALRLAGCER